MAACLQNPSFTSVSWRGRKTATAKRITSASVIESSVTVTEPRIVRAAKGETLERPPVWMMRQAGRYMQVYKDLCEKHTTFRERSETVDLAVEISLQPYRAFEPDGVILFSDILTPFSGMNIDFDIVQGKGPIIDRPVRTMEDVKTVQPLDPEEYVPFVGESLRILSKELESDPDTALLGFVGAPFTLAAYVVEGGSSKTFSTIKTMAFSAPDVLHALLDSFCDSIITYCDYQIVNGAQALQIFDSWAAYLAPADFEVFSLPYINKIVKAVKEKHPTVPLILYISGSGGLVEQMAATGVDIVSLDWSVDMARGRQRMGSEVGVQGNLDPAVLFAPQPVIEEKIIEVVRKAGGYKHIMNLGHGVMPTTPEENVAHFFEVCKTVDIRMKTSA